MQVGDLVKFFSDESDYAGEIGLIVHELNAESTMPRMLVQWPGGSGLYSYPARQLEVICESR
jgi:hypothetical protein